MICSIVNIINLNSIHSIKENSIQVPTKLKGQCLLSYLNNWPDYL